MRLVTQSRWLRERYSWQLPGQVLQATVNVGVTTVGSDMRGRAMGLLSMAIGALPIGTFLLGEIAEIYGAPAAVVVMASTGLVLLILWVSTHPELLAMGRSVDAVVTE